MIGRMTEGLIGAVGLKEFVFGTSFLSVSLKDQDSSEAAASSPLSISLCLTLLSRSLWLPSQLTSPFSAGVSLSLCFFSKSWEPSPSFSARPRCWLTAGQTLLRISREPRGREGSEQGLGWQSLLPGCMSPLAKPWKLSGPPVSSSINGQGQTL